MTRCMLDTNIISFLVRGNRNVEAALRCRPIETCCVSAIVEGEIRYSLAKHPAAVTLNSVLVEILRRFTVIAWDSATSKRYGTLRAQQEKLGRPLSSLDTLIAAHALAAGAVLVTNDRAFAQVEGLVVEDWTG